MTYDQLLEFVQDYMPKRMQHIYLPSLIGKLVDADGSATLRQLAQSVLSQDESQVMYYEDFVDSNRNPHLKGVTI